MGGQIGAEEDVYDSIPISEQLGGLGALAGADAVQ
jgi:hypothetical protein